MERVKILLVDDLKDNLLALEGLLRRDDVEIFKAKSGTEALEFMITNDFAVALIDVQMPGMSGFELAELMRGTKNTKNVPIIFVTANAKDQSFSFKGYESGAVDFLPKPLDTFAVKSKVNVFIELFRQKKEIMSAEAKFRGLLETAADAIVIVNEAGRIEMVNKQAETIFGYERSELINQPMEILMPERFRHAHVHKRTGYTADPRSRPMEGGLDLYGRRKDGTEFPVDISLSPLKTESGTLIASAIRDITERRTSEKKQEELLSKLKKTQGELEQAVQVRDEFIATLSHELRTPLTSILSWSQLIQKQKFDPDKLKHGIKMIEQSAKMQGQLIDDLLDITRIQSGKLSIIFTEVDPSEPVSLSIEAVRLLAENKQIVIESEIKIQSEKVWGDRERLQQIVWNLLTNAIKFSTNGGVIRVQVEPVEEHGDQFVMIKVIDQGKGVSPEFLPRLFERFSQADSSSVRVHGGLGLGLAIVRDLVTLQGGTVRAESDGIGKGATFTALFPIKSGTVGMISEPTSPTEAKTQKDVESADLADLRVMVVEDDPCTLEVLSAALNSFGAKTLPCSSAAEALAALEKFKPDVLVSDISMPGEDGYSLIRKIRKLGPEQCGDVPSLALTAYATEGDAKRALSAGFDSHMAKPFDTFRLGHVVAELARQTKSIVRENGAISK